MKKYDIAIIGGGLAGLTTAFHACKAGMSVVLLDRGSVGGGASGGLVGALAPHMPEHWNEKKQYQFEAMAISASFWGEVEALSGLTTGYLRAGRLQNIFDERGLEKALMRQEAAKDSWQGVGEWTHCTDDHHPFASTPFGYVRDTLSAQIMPRDAVIALGKAVEVMGAEIIENFTARDITENKIIGDWDIHAKNIVISAGHASWPWVRKYMGADFGEGTKGQAAIIKPKQAWDFPMVTGDGFYIVPHRKDRLAVGSTSERYWKHLNVDAQLDAILKKVASDCPELQDAEVLEKWSGIRPRAFRPDPFIGNLESRIFVNSGGFKTGFSFAPKLSQDLVGLIKGEDVSLPKGFTPHTMF